MKRYPKYKPFGNYWISEIPSHWNEQKIKHLFDERVEKGHPDEPLLAATQNQGVILKSDYESRTVEATKDLHLLKFVKVGDFVISLRSFQGGIEYSYCQGIISPAYTIMIPRPEIDSSYFRHLAKSRTFIELLKGCVTGIREGQNINYALLRTYLLPLPPLDEQKAIADFLDKKTEQIDRFISLQKEAISLLKELRQAEITKAVTKGLDENAEMKDSGVEWIGEIPKGWYVRRLRYYCNITTGDKDTVDRCDSGIYPFYVRSPQVERINTYSYDGEAILMAGDGVGAGKVFHYVNGKFDYHQRVYNLHNFKDINVKYLYYYMQENFWRKLQESNAKSTVDSVRLPMLLDFPILIGKCTEQKEIASYLDKKCAEIDSAIQNKEALIEKGTEYKTRLISDAVTGKIDVRGEDIKPRV